MTRKVLGKNQYSKLTSEINEYFLILEERVSKLEEDKKQLLLENRKLEKELLKLRQKKSMWQKFISLFKKDSENEDVVEEKYNTNPLDTRKLKEALNLQVGYKEDSDDKELDIVVEEEDSNVNALENTLILDRINSSIDREDYDDLNENILRFLSESKNPHLTYEFIKNKLPLENGKVLEVILENLNEELLLDLISGRQELLSLVEKEDYNLRLKIKILKIVYVYNESFSQFSIENLIKEIVESKEFLEIGLIDRELVLAIYIAYYDIQSPAIITDFRDYISKDFAKLLLEYFKIYREKKRAREFSKYVQVEIATMGKETINNKVRKKAYNYMANCANDIVISEKL